MSNQKYIISKEDSLLMIGNKTSSGVVLVPPNAMFGRYNFIIDSIGEVYFYSFQEPKITGGTFDEEEDQTFAPKPNHVFKLPKGYEDFFFRENVSRQKTSESIKTVMIASLKDSVEGDFIQVVKQIQKNDSSIHFSVRLASPMERELIEYKRQGRYYP